MTENQKLSFLSKTFPLPFSCLGVSQGPALLICFLLTNPAKYPMMFKRDNTKLFSAGSHCLYLMQRKFCNRDMHKLHETIWKSLAIFAEKGNQWSTSRSLLFAGLSWAVGAASQGAWGCVRALPAVCARPPAPDCLCSWILTFVLSPLGWTRPTSSPSARLRSQFTRFWWEVWSEACF